MMTNKEPLIDFSNHTIGEQYETIKLETSEQHKQACLCLIKQARRSIEVFSDNLDHRIFDSAEISSAIADFVRISPNSRLRVLLKDSTSVIARGHRWVELSRKFDSYIKIRKTHTDYQHIAYNFIIVDGRGLIYRPNASTYYGILDFNAAYNCRQHLEFFSEVWERSSGDPELNRLYL